MSEFGKVVKALRLADELSLTSVAKKLGSTKSYISGVENGKTNPPSRRFLERYQKLFAHRGVRLEDLLELAWVEKAPEAIRDRELARIRPTNPLFKIEFRPAEISVPERLPGPKAAV